MTLFNWTVTNYTGSNIFAVDSDSLMTFCSDGYFTFLLATSVDSDDLPADYVLEQNYPNPFNQTTWIRYGVAEAGEVGVIIFNMFGQRVRILESGFKEPGYYHVQWDGSDQSGLPVSTGVYFVMMQYGSHRLIRRVILIR